MAMMQVVDQADVDDDANTSELVRLDFHVDPRTNVAYLTGPDESVVESYVYDPYGNVTIRDRAGDPFAASPVGNPFTFQRRRLYEEIGLYYFRARHYDPVAGQWMQGDPLGLEPGANWREFCRSRPVGAVDPLGLDAVAVEAAAGLVDDAVDALTGMGRWVGRAVSQLARRAAPAVAVATAVVDVVTIAKLRVDIEIANAHIREMARALERGVPMPLPPPSRCLCHLFILRVWSGKGKADGANDGSLKWETHSLPGIRNCVQCRLECEALGAEIEADEEAAGRLTGSITSGRVTVTVMEIGITCP